MRSGEAEEERRVQRALLAHLRQEFMAPASAIIGYCDILIEDAKRHSFVSYLPDLGRIRDAANTLNSLLQSLLAKERSDNSDLFDPAKLRHDLRTPINAIKGYGEMLAEDAASDGHNDILGDLGKLLDAAGDMLRRIDALVDFYDEPNGGNEQAYSTGVDSALEAIRATRLVDPALASAAIKGRILIVDDNASNRDLLKRQMERGGHVTREAEGGLATLEALGIETFDLILLDLMMPDISGYEVLCRIKAQPAVREIPIIIMSALDDLDSITRCIEAGAVDYLLKPFDTALLQARIRASLENKVLRDREKVMMDELRREKIRYEDLLLSILPRKIVDRINNGERVIADQVDAVTILFADIVGFTKIAAQKSAAELIQFLNFIFSAFDDLSEKFGAEKIKTIGDAYMVAFGLPESRKDHAGAAALLAHAMLKEISQFRSEDGVPVNLRIGIHTGSAVAGVIGQRKFSFDVWGNTVNIASRMESHGEPGKIHVSEDMANLLSGKFILIERGMTDVKGAGLMRTFFLGEPINADVPVTSL